jgi:hypothetical protein
MIASGLYRGDASLAPVEYEDDDAPGIRE